MPTEPYSDLIAGANQRREVDALFVNAPLRDYAEVKARPVWRSYLPTIAPARTCRG
jgi:hypothetical protein